MNLTGHSEINTSYLFPRISYLIIKLDTPEGCLVTVNNYSAFTFSYNFHKFIGLRTRNCMRLKKTECQVLHLDHNNPIHFYRLGSEWLESCTKEKNLVVLVGSTEHEPAVCPISQDHQWHPGLYQKQCIQQD